MSDELKQTTKSETKPPAKKIRRKLTPFLCQEMLYDYALDRLDADRRAAVDEFMKNDRECQEILEGIRKGLKYADELSGIELSPEITAHIRESENAVSLGRKYSSFREWNEVVRWVVVAVLIVIGSAGVLRAIPYQRLQALRSKKSDTIELAQVNRPAEPSGEAPVGPDAENAPEQGSGDEEMDAEGGTAPAKGTKSVAEHAAAKPAAGEETGDEGGEEAAAPAAKIAHAPPPPPAAPKAAPQPAPPATTVAAAAAPSKSQGADKEDQTEERSEKKEAKPKGFVFRAFMTLSNLDEIGPKITENITELGGQKAGEVELGWKRGSGRYYHFALPEDNEEKLLEKLRAYGPVRISKDPHPRVMPQGQVRFILWVESAR